MAFKWFRLDFNDTGNFTRQGSRYTRRYKAESNNAFDTPASLKRDRLCPQVGAQDPYDRQAIIDSVQLERRERSKIHWMAAVTSTTEIENEDEDENPLDLPALIFPASDNYIVKSERDCKGKLITNAAGDVVPYEREETNWIFSVQKNVRTIPAWLLEFNNSINNGAVFLGSLNFPKHTLMVKGLGGSPQSTRIRATGQRLDYYDLGYQLHYKRGGWKVTFPNVGYNQLSIGKRVVYYPMVHPRTGVPLLERDKNGELRPRQRKVEGRMLEQIIDPDTGLPIPKSDDPWPLDKKGRALDKGYTADQYTYIEVKDAYPEKSFYLLPR